MPRTYSIVSPSLEGVLTHESLSYDGISRPSDVLRAYDRPSAASRRESLGPHESKLLERYFFDLYGVFMKRLSAFVLDAEPAESETVRLQAMLQEMVKVKKLISSEKAP